MRGRGLVIGILAQLCFTAHAYDNGYGLKPFLGWQSWCAVGKCGTDACYDRQIRQTADAMHANGMAALGFEWIVIDDCWHPTRDANGTLVPFAEYFPHGMKAVADYVHSLGLKFGLYTSVGTLTCHKGWSPGSFGYYEQDAALFASWGIDYVKMDWCGENKSIAGHQNFSRALNATGRPMAFELCRGDYEKLDHWGYAPGIAQVWRADGDHHDSFSHTLEQLAAIKGKSTWSGPYGWAYMDMMMTGGEGCEQIDPKHPLTPDPDHPCHAPGCTDAEYRTEGATYSISASPMMIGTDIRLMTPIMKQILLNPTLISINQDHLAAPGFETTSCGDAAWVRHLSNGSTAVTVVNMAASKMEVQLCLEDIGWNNANTTRKNVAIGFDIWAGTTSLINGFVKRSLESHDNLFFMLSPPPPGPPGPAPPPPIPPPPTPPPSPGPGPGPEPAPAGYMEKPNMYCSDHGGTRIFDVQGETLEKCAAKCNAAGATQCKCFDFNLGSGECRGVNNVSLQATAHGDNAYVRA